MGPLVTLAVLPLVPPGNVLPFGRRILPWDAPADLFRLAASSASHMLPPVILGSRGGVGVSGGLLHTPW